MKVEGVVGLRELRARDAELLDRLAARGILRRGVGKPGNAYRVKPRRARHLLSDIVLEDRTTPL